MSAEVNKQRAEEAYRAFGAGDAEAAMRNMDDSVRWIARGDNALAGTYTGKGEIAGLWAQVAEKGLRSEPHDFIAEGDKVVVLTTLTLDGEQTESADVLRYNDEGKLVTFEQVGDPRVFNRVFAR